MVYCPKCGKKNEEDARFCNSCGANLVAPRREYGKDFEKHIEKECERDCTGTARSSRIFWGVILLLFGLFLIFEFGLKNIQGMPSWVVNFEFWWIFAVVIGIVIIIAAVRMLTKKERP